MYAWMNESMNERQMWPAWCDVSNWDCGVRGHVQKSSHKSKELCRVIDSVDEDNIAFCWTKTKWLPKAKGHLVWQKRKERDLHWGKWSRRRRLEKFSLSRARIMWMVGQFFLKMSRETVQALRECSRWLKRQMENGTCKTHVTGLQSKKTQQAFEWTGRRSRGAICNPGVTPIPALPSEMTQFTAQPGMRVSLFFFYLTGSQSSNRPWWTPRQSKFAIHSKSFVNL